MRFHIVLSLALVCAVARGASLPAFIENADHLRLGDAKSVDNAGFAIGHLKMKFTSGSAAPVFAGSEQVGIFFSGKGALEYETTETAEFPVVTHNVRAVAHLKMTPDPSHIILSDDFSDVLIVAGGVQGQRLRASGQRAERRSPSCLKTFMRAGIEKAAGRVAEWFKAAVLESSLGRA